ncbi:AAA family ATPase [Vibrio vulnificus]|uniref:AAA family ATPase n=1 Tax=Vibrio vulnificus TaxID=672 RepID=UPI0032428779
MIFSVILRNFKVYAGWHYIPLSTGEHFSSLVGENGVGKSSVLESLDVFFNAPFKSWNYNHAISKSGFDRKPTICPIFIIEKSKVNKNRNVYKYMEQISNITWQIEVSDFSSSFHRNLISTLEIQIKKAKEEYHNIDDEYFLIPCGYEKSVSETIHSIGLFKNNPAYESDLKEYCNVTLDHAIKEINDYISENYEYIYIPSEIDYESYTKIEGSTIQALMGKSVEAIIKEFVDESIIKNINSGLDVFLKDIEKNLEKYEYKKPSRRQTLFNLSHLTSKIIETYFESKVLNLKNESGNSTPIYHFSSGEKRKAIIDLSQAFILNSNRDFKNKTVIIAIDEPEVSLHSSACFEQFRKIENISNHSVQTIISTHWYGFLTSVSSGNTTYIANNDDESKTASIINLKRFREDIKQLKASTNGRLPSTIELKSINDLVQSVISSITCHHSKWIICEGISDKTYLNYYLRHRKDINILSMGGSVYVKKFHEYIYLALEEERSEIKGKVYFLLDTDKKFERFSCKESIKSVTMKRLKNDINKNKTVLLKTSDNDYYPPTEIEDVLDSKAFFDTIMNSPDIQKHPILFNKFSNMTYNDFDPYSPSGLAFDLKDSEKIALESFFDQPKTKSSFAKGFCLNVTNEHLPDWLSEIIKFLDS